MTMNADETTLHRTAKYFMDSGRAKSPEEAIEILQGFGLTIRVGPEIRESSAHQIAMLSLVNLARRTFLGGVEVVGVENDVSHLTALSRCKSLADAVVELGGRVGDGTGEQFPVVLIGTAQKNAPASAAWRATWGGWRAGAVPARSDIRLPEDDELSLAPALAAAFCAAEVFAYLSGDHEMAGRRTIGLSLWHPDRDWLEVDGSEPHLAYLPSRLWLIGLGNLGQAFAWLIATLPYADFGRVQIVLQDFDRIAESNNSTSLFVVHA